MYITNDITSDNKYFIVSNDRPKKSGKYMRGGGTPTLVSKSYAFNLEKVDSNPQTQPVWLSLELLGKLETTIIKFRPSKLPKGFSCIIEISAYIMEWEESKQRSSIFQLLNQITEVTSNNKGGNIFLIFLAGGLNGAYINHVSKEFCLRRLNNLPTREGNILDVIFTNSPDSYVTSNFKPLDIKGDHDIVIAHPYQDKHSSTIAPSTKFLVRSVKSVTQLHN